MLGTCDTYAQYHDHNRIPSKKNVLPLALWKKDHMQTGICSKGIAEAISTKKIYMGSKLTMTHCSVSYIICT